MIKWNLHSKLQTVRAKAVTLDLPVCHGVFGCAREKSGSFSPVHQGEQKKKKEKSGDKEVVVVAAADVNRLDVYISVQFFS
jgi:hypothetical protein